MDHIVALNIAAWLGCAAFVVALLNGVFKLLDRFKDKPPASDVRAELVEKFTPKELFNAHVAQNLREHENIFSKLGGVERGAQEKIIQLERSSLTRMDSISTEWRSFVEVKFADMAKEDRIGREKLHDRLNIVLQAVARLEGEFKSGRKA